ncbi:hypothetical protein ACJ8J6_01005 [Serratia sp. CY47279]|uniref:hypothetical protein n=1 Tax=Serratia sp. CY47279 TaxID=3383624 RepID=UPI003F9EEEC0
MTLTTETLNDFIAGQGFGVAPSALEAMTRELLANREAQPVLYASEETLAYAKEGEKSLVTWSEPMGDAVIPLYTTPPAPAPANAVAWEMRYWNSGYNCWHDWERITAKQHAEMSAEHAADNDYEFRVLYDAPPAPAANTVPDFEAWFNSPEAGLRVVNFHIQHELQLKAWNACVAAMLAQPVSGGYKLPPHVYRELVNSLRDTAVKFSGTEQLRERLNTALSQFIEPDHPHTRTVAPEGGN